MYLCVFLLFICMLCCFMSPFISTQDSHVLYSFRNLVSASQDGKLIVWDGYTANKVSRSLLVEIYFKMNPICFSCFLVINQLLLADRALSRDYLVKMWSSKMLYLSASRAEGHYFWLMYGLQWTSSENPPFCFHLKTSKDKYSKHTSYLCPKHTFERYNIVVLIYRRLENQNILY